LQAYRAKYTGPLKGPEIVKAAAGEWNGLVPAERRPWEASKDELAAYGTKLKEYTESGRREAWRRDPAKPRLPATAFFKFAAEVRSKHPDKKVTEQTKLAAGLWKHMSAAERAPYESGYAEEKRRYTVAMEQYKASGLEKAWNDRVGNTARLAKAEALKLKRAEAEKKKKAAAALKKQKAAEKKKAAAALKKQKAAAEKKRASDKKVLAAEKKQKALGRARDLKVAAKEKVVLEKNKAEREKRPTAAAQSQGEVSKN